MADRVEDSVAIDMSSAVQEEFKYPWTLVREVSAKDKAKTLHMHNKWREIETELAKNEKWFERWSWWDSLVRNVYRIFIAFCMISSTVVSTVAGATAIPTLSFVAAGLAAIGSLQEPLEKLFITEFTTRKRKKYQDKCRIRRKYLDRMFIYYLEASKDNEISTDELKHYVDLAYQMDEELMKASMEQQDLLSHIMELQNTETTKSQQTASGNLPLSTYGSTKQTNEATPLLQEESQIDG